MVARADNGLGSEAPGDSQVNFWPRCESALTGSRIALSASDLEGRYTWIFNAAPEFGTELTGRKDADHLPDEVVEKLTAARNAALASGDASEIELELLGDRGPRWFDVRVMPHAEEGEFVGTVSALVDVTDRKVQEEHLRIVLRELAHRSKNLLAVIQGIARQTAESAASTKEFLNRFNGRLFSLSRAHDVLTDADWRGARIFDLVRSQIALYAEDQLPAIEVAGENGFLRPNAAQYIGLALHELTTNALKYGALSREGGRVTVSFDRRPDSYRFVWHEHAVSEINAPRGRNFGLIMLGDVVPASVSGVAKLDFQPDGLRYELDMPRSQLVG